MDLVQWLTAQLDEDERIARAVKDRSAPWDGQWMADGDSAVRTFNGHVLFYRHGPDPLKPGLADHVAEWDPARVLREIDAKRRLLSEYADVAANETDNLDEAVEYADGWANGLGLAVRLLALPYADRPGYLDSWRP